MNRRSRTLSANTTCAGFTSDAWRPTPASTTPTLIRKGAIQGAPLEVILAICNPSKPYVKNCREISFQCPSRWQCKALYQCTNDEIIICRKCDLLRLPQDDSNDNCRGGQSNQDDCHGHRVPRFSCAEGTHDDGVLEQTIWKGDSLLWPRKRSYTDESMENDTNTYNCGEPPVGNTRSNKGYRRSLHFSLLPVGPGILILQVYKQRRSPILLESRFLWETDRPANTLVRSTPDSPS